MDNYIVVGCGFAGAVLGRLIAEELDEKVTICDKRPHIAGNMYDYYDKAGVLVHKYGPHILVINHKECFDFLSRFTAWTYYEHRVDAEVCGVQVPLPINFTSINKLFPVEKAQTIIQALTTQYGENSLVRILDMKESDNPIIKEFADFVYRHVFVDYTMKMWGLSPTEISPEVTGRIPVRLSYDSRHFLQKYQYMPQDGYTKLFEKMLDHPNIHVELGVNACDHITLDNGCVLWDEQPYRGKVIYTGSIDELLDYRYGVLPYRSLSFTLETWNKDYVQEPPVLNWPDSRPQTRRTEMKRLTQQQIEGVTTTLTETPGQYVKEDTRFGEPYYPIVSDECKKLYQTYTDDLEKYSQIILAGRLAEYKYYNMEATIVNAFRIFQKLK